MIFDKIKNFFQKEAKCPYCSFDLKKMPVSKMECPNCGNDIYLRIDPKTRNKILLTEKQSNEMNKELQKNYLKNEKQIQIEEHKRFLFEKGIKEDEFNKIKNNLPEINEKDAIWECYNLLLDRYDKDYKSLSYIYFNMAQFLLWEGKDPFKALENKAIMDLYQHKTFTKKYKIICIDGCSECEKNKDRIYSFEEALKEMPIPNKNCKMLDCGNYPYCKCYWSPVYT